MKPAELATRYRGERAEKYDERRVNTPQWQREQDTVRAYLSTLPKGASVLDAPVGTGRFLPLYNEMGLDPTGLDVSPDMLAVARTKGRAGLREGSVLDLPYPARHFDAVVCVRFLNWIDGEVLDRALSEITRVSRGVVICNIKTYIPAAEMGMGTKLRQWRHRYYEMRGKGTGWAPHEHDRVQALLKAHGLHAVQRTDERRERFTRIGVAATFYLLNKVTDTP